MANGWRAWTLSATVSWLMKLFLVGLLPYLIFIGDYLFAVMACIAVVLSLVPSVVERNKNIHLPFELDLLVTLAIFSHTFLGEWLMFYERVRLWDKILHLFGTAVISITAFMTVYTLHYTRKIRLSVPLIGFFTVIFAIAIGALWEVTEFLVDILFGTTTQKGLRDTMWDLVYDLIAGVAVAVFGMIYVKYSDNSTRDSFTRPFGEIFGRGRTTRRGRRRNRI